MCGKQFLFWEPSHNIRTELEGRKGKKYFSCRKFGHLVHNRRNSVGEEKGKPIPKNKFEVLVSQVMQCEVRGEVEVRQQERGEEEVQCFRCWGVGYQKQKCPDIEVERKRQCVWPGHKRHSKRGGQCVPHGKRYRSTVTSRACSQKVLSYLIKDRLQRRWQQPMQIVEDMKIEKCRPMKIKDRVFSLRDK